MNLLLLGGTAFLGRAVAAHARDMGISVTCLARGSAPAPEGVELVRADRNADDGLSAVTGRWDAVVDVARQPGHVRRAVRDLRPDHWVLVSTASVYARFDRPHQDEAAPLLRPLEGDVMSDLSEYGSAKVACEEAVRGASSSSTVIRSGLITGPGDTSGRGGYYPWRLAHPTGPDVLVPPDLSLPVALIDVDDLAAWIVVCARDRVEGTFNATGPTTTLGDLLETCRDLLGASAPEIRPVPAEVLRREGVVAWMGPRSLPLWIDDPAWRHFATLDTSRGRARGLVTRPLTETMARALAYEECRSSARQCGLTDDEERSLRTALGD